MMNIEQLHYITQSNVPKYTLLELVEVVCKNGVKCVQYREKNKNYDEFLAEAIEVQEICKYYQVQFIVNDRIEIAKIIQADGVHLGKKDFLLSDARDYIGKNTIIGATSNEGNDIENALRCGADYVGLGPLHFTSTKEVLSPILGINGIHELCAVYGDQIPIIAIGGIMPEDIPLLWQNKQNNNNPSIEIVANSKLTNPIEHQVINKPISKLHGVAVAGGINNSPDPAMSVKKYLAALAMTE